VALTFRQRLFAWLVTASVVPAAIAVAVAVLSPQVAAPVGGVLAWEQAAQSWRTLRAGMRDDTLPPVMREAFLRHDAQISTSLRRARQARAIREAFGGVLAGIAAGLTVLVGGGAIRLAGHLSRQLSRPIDELVDWTGRLRRGEPLPDAAPPRGAPEFASLREAFRATAEELERARTREVEAAELRVFREMARQVAHELKNPLTPMRFALERLASVASPQQREELTVLEAESTRLERMARDFAELGRLPEGPAAEVDLGELLEEIARSRPDGVAVGVDRAPDVPRVRGHYEPLRRALANLVLNAYDAVRARGGGSVRLGVRRASGVAGTVIVTISDDGVGIPEQDLPHVFEPYHTTKPGGTGLGLAIVRQTVHHHGGTVAVDSAPGRGTTFTVTLPTGAA
jgi:signal transduction histidine kinase